jgi:alpha-glucosidase
VVDAQIEDYVIIARRDRNSEDWYLGAITDEEARQFDVVLDFLDESRSYVAQIYRDDTNADYQSNPAAYTIVEQMVSKSDTLDIELARGGGTAVRFIAQ